MTRAAAISACVVLVACGPAAGPSGGGGMRNPSVVHEQDERARLCTAAATLHAASCAPFDAWPSAQLDDCSVVERLYLSGYASCLADSACDGVRACVAKVDAGGAAPYAGPTRTCADPITNVPAGVTADELAKSYGAHDRTFADSPSSVKRPIEVCGAPAELDYLMRLTCPNGSRPFADRAAAVATGLGNVGPGGRCGRLIDHFVAPCGEHPYDVFLDAYRCPAHGSMSDLK